MRVSDKVREQRYNSLKKTYPEVCDYLHSDGFTNKFTESDSISIFYYSKSYFSDEYNKELPITDSNGVVDIDDLIEILRYEGFSSYIDDDYMTEVFTLVVSL